MALNITPDVTAFLKRNHVAVLATANKDTSAPHAATVFYATDSQLNIFFITKEDTTKSKNLDSNPQAAIAIYEADTLRTAQIAGQVSRVEDKEMMEKALRIMSKYSQQVAGTPNTPISRLDSGEYILYKLWPSYIRLGDYKYGTHDQLFDIAVPGEETLPETPS